MHNKHYLTTMRHGWKKKIVFCGSLVIFLLIILHPDMNVRGNYEYIEKDVIVHNLHEETAANFTSSAVLNCDYRDVIFDDTTLSLSLADGDLIENHKIKEGGEYAPSDCKPKFSTAIIVPYRLVFSLQFRPHVALGLPFVGGRGRSKG